MTLRGFVKACLPSKYEEVSLIPSLAELKLRDFGDLCFFAVGKYFLSEKFSADEEEVRLDYAEHQYNGFNSYLFITRDEEGIFSLKISHDESETNIDEQ